MEFLTHSLQSRPLLALYAVSRFTRRVLDEYCDDFKKLAAVPA